MFCSHTWVVKFQSSTIIFLIKLVKFIIKLNDYNQRYPVLYTRSVSYFYQIQPYLSFETTTTVKRSSLEETGIDDHFIWLVSFCYFLQMDISISSRGLQGDRLLVVRWLSWGRRGNKGNGSETVQNICTSKIVNGNRFL